MDSTGQARFWSRGAYVSIYHPRTSRPPPAQLPLSVNSPTTYAHIHTSLSLQLSLSSLGSLFIYLNLCGYFPFSPAGRWRQAREPGVFLCGAPMSGYGSIESSSLAPPHYICFVLFFWVVPPTSLTSTPACASVRYDNTHTRTNTSQEISHMDPFFENLSFAQTAKTCPFSNQARWLVKRISTTGSHTCTRDRDRKQQDTRKQRLSCSLKHALVAADSKHNPNYKI
jgi:hypothetical protein